MPIQIYSEIVLLSRSVMHICHRNGGILIPSNPHEQKKSSKHTQLKAGSLGCGFLMLEVTVDLRGQVCQNHCAVCWQTAFPGEAEGSNAAALAPVVPAGTSPSRHPRGCWCQGSSPGAAAQCVLCAQPCARCSPLLVAKGARGAAHLGRKSQDGLGRVGRDLWGHLVQRESSCPLLWGVWPEPVACFHVWERRGVLPHAKQHGI